MKSNKNQNGAGFLPNVNAELTAPQTEINDHLGGNPGRLAPAICSAAACSENLALPRFELQVPDYNNEGQPIKLKMNLPEIQVMIDQVAFQLYGEKYDPILAQAIS